MNDSALNRLAQRCGILPEYWQIDGTHRPTGRDTMIALLAGMGIDAHNENAAQASLNALETRDAARSVPREILVRAETQTQYALPDWTIELEQGGHVRPDPAAPDVVPPLPAGVHELRAGADRALVIASPAQAPGVHTMTGQDRSWGIWTSLYGQRSSRNAGVGDYEDLAQLGEALAPTGASFLGINPVHTRGIAGGDPSPYSPSSRTALDTHHIALDRVPEFARAPQAQALFNAAEPGMAHARASNLIDRDPHTRLAGAILPILFETFEAKGDPRRKDAFARWLRARDDSQPAQSVFEALSRRHGPDWREWPAGLQNPGNPEVRTFAQDHSLEIRFHDWCQWIAASQLEEAQTRSTRAGMTLGLYLDIAVGVRQGGAETWARREAFAQGVSLGAPPDLLNTQGQCWNLAGFSPVGVAADDYRAFRTMLRSTMASAGVVRIDHVIGLRRAFWVPDNGAPGGYVEFPVDTLLALIRIEAQRAGCIVIGEDLGTVPEGLRDALAGSGLYGCSIVPFERSGDGFSPPEHHHPKSLASFGTHDLPSLAGWWQGLEIALRQTLGHYDEDTAARERDARAHERRALCRLLAERGLLPADVDADNPPEILGDALLDALHALLARSGAELVALSLDDIFMLTEQQNVPGTTDEAPNWRRRGAAAIEDIARREEIHRAAHIMNAARPAAHNTETKYA